MKITVFGATGMVGKYIINEAIGRLHSVRAFGRNVYEALSTERTHLELFKGYLFSENDIKDALKGTDAVLSAIGGSVDGTDKARSIGMKKIVSVMEKHGPKRIIAIGGIGVLNADEQTYIFQTPDFPKQFLPLTNEHFAAYLCLANSSLDWTLLCPPDIINAGPTGEYSLNRNYPAEGQFRINAGDLADFMVKELENNEYLKCRVGIAAK